MTVVDSMVGRQIGGYIIQRRLAEGGMGAVYHAVHGILGTEKAIKVMLPMYAENADLRARFEREALAVSKMKHRNIVAIDEYGQLPDGQLFLMMPFLSPGRSLDDYVRTRGPLSELEALRILAQACSALDYMHQRSFVHRDIKPANIFLVEESDDPLHVYLIDLGLAKNTGQRGLTQMGGIAGTPEYMAVEQFANPMSITGLADVFALAVVAWEIVTGRRPWPDTESVHTLYDLKLNQPPQHPAGLSDGWFEVLAAALSPVTARRPQSAGELAFRLASTLRDGAEVLREAAPSLVARVPSDSVTLRRGVPQGMPLSTFGSVPELGVPNSTTLSSSVGVATTTVPPARSRWPYYALAGVLVAGAATATTFVLTRVLAQPHASEPTGAQQPAEPPLPQRPPSSANDAAGRSSTANDSHTSDRDAHAQREHGPTNAPLDAGPQIDANVPADAAAAVIPPPPAPSGTEANSIPTPPARRAKPQPAVKRVDTPTEKPKPKFNPNAPMGGEGS